MLSYSQTSTYKIFPLYPIFNVDFNLNIKITMFSSRNPKKIQLGILLDESKKFQLGILL